MVELQPIAAMGRIHTRTIIPERVRATEESLIGVKPRAQ